MGLVKLLIDINDERLQLAQEQGLADVLLNPLKVDVEKEILRMTEGGKADCAFEVAGNSNTFEMAWKVARPNTNAVLVVLYPEAQSLPLHLMYGKTLLLKQVELMRQLVLTS